MIRSRILEASRLLLLAALAGAPPAVAQERAYLNARIVDPASRTVAPAVIVVRGGRIASVAPSAPADFRGEASIFAGAG
jgi:hypothetical protein